MTLDFTPNAAAAPPVRRVLSHGLTETKLMLRNGEQLLLAVVIPLGMVIIGHLLGGRFGELPTLVPSVFALAIWSTAFTSVAIATGFERRYGVLERLVATPLGKSGLLAGKVVAVSIVVAGQVLILAVAGLLLGWRPQLSPGSALLAMVVAVVATGALVCCALLLAGRLRAETTLALANLVYVVGLLGGAVIVPVDRYPAVVQPIIEVLPTAALGEGLRCALAAPRCAFAGGMPWLPLLILLGWLVVGAATAWRGFRWTS